MPKGSEALLSIHEQHIGVMLDLRRFKPTERRAS